MPLRIPLLTAVSSAFSGLQCNCYLLAVGILVDLQLQDQAAGNLQGLEEVAQGRVDPCLPLVDLSLTCLLTVTVVGTSGGTCGATAGLVPSVAGPLLEEGMFGNAAGLQSLEGEGSAWDLGLHN